MGQFLLPGIGSTDRTAMTLDAREIVYDTNDSRLYYGDGASAGGILIATGNGGGAADGLNRIAAGTQTAGTLATVVFSNSNGITFGMSNSSVVTASHNGLTTARASNDAIGLNTAFTAGPLAWTVNSSGLSLNAGSAAGTTSGFAGNLISGSMTHNTAGLNLSLDHPAWLTTAMQSNAATISNIRVSAGTTSNLLSAITFSNSNGITFGLDASTITASHNGLTTARASNDAVGLNTAQTNVTWTVNSSGISLNAGGYAGTGTSATNASITLNSNGLAISVAAPGGGGAVNFSAGTTSNDLQTVVFSNSNGISFGLNGSTITAQNTTLNGYLEAFIDRELLAAQIGNNQLFVQPLNARAHIQFDQIAWFNNYSNATNSSNSATLTLRAGIYTRNESTLSLVTEASNTFAVTNSGTVGSYSIYGGMREYGLGLTTTLTQGNYWIGFLSRTTTGGGAGMTWSNFVASNINSAYSGRWSSANNATNQFAMGLGSYATTTTAIPSSIAFNQINGSAAANLRPVIFKLVSQDLN